MHVIGGAGAGIVGLHHGILHQPGGGLLQMTECGGERRDIGLHRLVGAVVLGEGCDLAEEGHHGAAAVARQFAAHQIKRLNTVGAFIDHRNARIAHELLHAVFGDIAVAAVYLLCQHRIGEARHR